MEKNRYIQLFEKYLRNNISEEEKQQFEEILRDDKQIQSILDTKLENSDSNLDEETSMRLYEHIRAAIVIEKKSKPTFPIWRKIFRWAAIIALPVISALTVYFLIDRNPANNTTLVTITAGKGEKAEITLADGSRVWINSESTISYDASFNRKERNVFLSGEAYFEVEKNKKCPFIVKTKEMDIQALGTSFNVSAYGSERYYSSVLLDGEIKVTANGQEFILKENERATYDTSNQTLSTGMVYASDFVEWKNGNLYFQNQSFEEISRTLERVFNVEIGFVSEELRPIRFTGTLGGSSIRNTLDILSLTSPMRYEMNGTVIELYYKE